MSKSERIKVISLMGCGRSSSTVLDIPLGNHGEIVCVGALSNFFDWDIEREVCACAQTLDERELSRDVKEWYYQQVECQDPQQNRRAQLRVESSQHRCGVIVVQQ